MPDRAEGARAMTINKNKLLIKRAKILRKNSTLSEILLWRKLKNKQIKNKRFRRQAPIGGYIIDFYCHELRMAIEIDGGSHYENEAYDKKRDIELKELGINILHISDKYVKQSIQGVIWEIEEWIDENGIN